MAEISHAKGGLEGLFRRPKTSYDNLEKETVSVTPRSSDLIYIRSCTQCKFTFQGKAAKCIIESSSDVQVEFVEPLIAGTLEMISSKNVTIFINPHDRLPTISADGCTNIHLHLFEPRAMGLIYTVNCSDVVVHFQPPHTLEHVLELPPDDSESQYVAEFRDGKMAMDKVIREGAGYATTVEKKELADKRQKELQDRFEEYVLGMLKISKPQEKGKTQAVAGKGASPKPVAVKEGPPKGGPPKDELKSKAAGDDGNLAVSPGNASSDDPLAAALRAKRGDLKPTETVERHQPVVGTGAGGGGFNPAIKEDEEKKEFFDSEEELAKKLDKTAEWLKQSKHAIVFTGAGVSTSAGIPDFRSGMKTVLPTGPGVWELRAHAAAPSKSSHIVPLLKALPTQTHMAIVKLHETDQVKFTISQNVDGLHRRSGLGPTQLAELHGNMNLETCQKCHKQYLRDFETREAVHVHDHRTDRVCDDPNCRGTLVDSIINFGEMLPRRELEEAFAHAQKADLCIVLGSSLRVRPACQVPEVVQAAGGKVVICNLQRIRQFPQDNKTIQVFSKCDDFIKGLLQRLGLEIPNFVLQRRARISAEKKEDSCEVTVTGLDVKEDAPYSFIKSISASHAGKHYESSVEPLCLKLPPDLDQLVVTVHFHGHYGEPSLAIQYLVSSGARVYQMGYDVIGHTWTVE